VVNDDDWTVDDEESTAQLMEIAGEMYDAEAETLRKEQELNRRVEEEMNHQVQQELEEMQRNAAIGQVIAADHIENDEVQDELPKQSFWNSKRNRVAIFVIVFMCIGIVLGAILSECPDSPTPSPVPTSEVDAWTNSNSCDESSSSLAKRLPCYSQNTSKYPLDCGINLVLSSLYVLSCLLVIFHSTAQLYLWGSNLMDTIPSQLGLLSKLSKSSVAWLLVCLL
jgi:hypothetical protein